MIIDRILSDKNMTRYALAKESGVPYTTITDLCTGKTNIAKCSAVTLYKLAFALDVTMEELLVPALEQSNSFEIFKSNACHRLKELGDIAFMIELLETDLIRTYCNKRKYKESLYLLAMLDYLSRLVNIPLCDRYDDLRRRKLRTLIYPTSVLAMAAVSKNGAEIKANARSNAIPEFLRFNIVESEVRNVI